MRMMCMVQKLVDAVDADIMKQKLEAIGRENPRERGEGERSRGGMSLRSSTSSMNEGP